MVAAFIAFALFMIKTAVPFAKRSLANMVEQTTSRVGGLRDDNNGIANVDIDRTKSYRCR